MNTTALPGRYRIGNLELDSTDAGFGRAIASAYRQHLRPRCLCVPGGAKMYIARMPGVSDDLIVKRMPGSAACHAVDCRAFEQRITGTNLNALRRDPEAGRVSCRGPDWQDLRLGFPLIQSRPHRSRERPPPRPQTHEWSSDRLSLDDLLHVLWQQAELDIWHPSFEGKRHWGVVRRRLLQAAEDLRWHGEPLSRRLYIPEPFSVEHRDAIHHRRLHQWQAAVQPAATTQPLLLVVAELKTMVRTPTGQLAYLRHVPDAPFRVEGHHQLWRQVEQLHPEPMNPPGNESHRLILCGTFIPTPIWRPRLVDHTTMQTTRRWLWNPAGRYKHDAIGTIAPELDIHPPTV